MLGLAVVYTSFSSAPAAGFVIKKGSVPPLPPIITYKFTRNLVRLAHKTSKHRLQGGFYLANSQNSPENRGFCVINDVKIHKCGRLLERRLIL
jgi:hypothetical protein